MNNYEKVQKRNNKNIRLKLKHYRKKRKKKKSRLQRKLTLRAILIQKTPSNNSFESPIS